MTLPGLDPASPIYDHAKLLGNWNRLREPRRGLMLHYDGSANDRGAVAWLTKDPRCKLSYNWLILDLGNVVTVAPSWARAWHAGVCRSSDPARLPYQDANSAFYGISLAATAGDHATPAAIAAILTLCRSLYRANQWAATETWRIVGHETEAWPRGRKVDPTGPDRANPVLSIAVIRERLGGL